MEQLAGRLAGGFIQPIEADLSTKRFGIPSRARCRPLRSRARHSAPAGKGPAAAGGNRGNSACEARWGYGGAPSTKDRPQRSRWRSRGCASMTASNLFAQIAGVPSATVDPHVLCLQEIGRDGRGV